MGGKKKRMSFSQPRGCLKSAAGCKKKKEEAANRSRPLSNSPSELTCPVAAVRASGLLELLLPVCGAAAAERHGSHGPVERGLDENHTERERDKTSERLKEGKKAARLFDRRLFYHAAILSLLAPARRLVLSSTIRQDRRAKSTRGSRPAALAEYRNKASSQQRDGSPRRGRSQTDEREGRKKKVLLKAFVVHWRQAPVAPLRSLSLQLNAPLESA